jgi:hypothetical protein
VPLEPSNVRRDSSVNLQPPDGWFGLHSCDRGVDVESAELDYIEDWV